MAELSGLAHIERIGRRMGATPLEPGDAVELAELRRRAYGTPEGIGADPGALARLELMENAASSSKRASVAVPVDRSAIASPEDPAPSAIEAPGSSPEKRPTTPSPTGRHSHWLTVAISAAGGAVATAVALSALYSSGTPDVTEDKCLAVSSGAQAALQRGLDDVKRGIRILDIAATVSESGDTWFVAATLSPDRSGTDKGVWFTTQNPTTATNPSYTSLDIVAQTVSSFEPPQGGGSMTMPGARESLDCIGW